MLIEIEEDRIVSVTSHFAEDDAVLRGATTVGPVVEVHRLPGLTLPGLANAHSHAFQRALRGRTHAETGSFWTWREQMYALAGALDPDTCFALSRATFGEMALAGITCVGEFHYLHHAPDGTPYDDPNAMGRAVLAAAAEARVRITLLDACYLHGGIERFRDADAGAWAERVDAAGGAPDRARRRGDPQRPRGRPGVGPDGRGVGGGATAARPRLRAAEGERGVPRGARPHADRAARRRRRAVGALHRRPRDPPDRRRRRAARRRRRDRLPLPDHRARPRRRHRPRAAAASTPAPRSPPAATRRRSSTRSRRRARSSSTSGSRPASAASTGATDLLRAATASGYAALGWPEGGRLEPGALADLTTVSLDGVRLAGTRPEEAIPSVVFAAAPADVRHVMVGGRWSVRDGEHVAFDVAAELRAALAS